jgi:hypothetical protein
MSEMSAPSPEYREASIQQAEEMLQSKGLSVLQREVLKSEAVRQKKMLETTIRVVDNSRQSGTCPR